MKKGAKIGITITSLVVAGVGIYFLGRALKWWGPGKYGMGNGGDYTSSPSKCQSGHYLTKDCSKTTLKKGDNCKDVAELQKHLNDVVGKTPKLEVDGCWGKKTDANADGVGAVWNVNGKSFGLANKQLIVT